MWGMSAVLFLAIVIGVYTLYDKTNENNNQHAHEVNHESTTKTSHEHSSSEHDNHSDHNEIGESEVTTNMTYNANDAMITIDVKDQDGHAPELVLSHEKRMHLIVVSQDLSHFYHLHPEEKGDGIYNKEFHLPNGAYKVFVDMKPKQLAYHVNPIELHVGENHHNHESNNLTPDETRKKTIDGKKVKLTTTPLQAGKSVMLTFDTRGHKPEPYLGALGHVVILDEKGERFLHVHPTSDNQTIFETTFAQPGTYKIWGEFKFEGNIHTYPFVVEVK